MRTSTILLTASAGAALTLALPGTALADPAAASAEVMSDAALTVSPGTAAPGTSVRISGTCATPTDSDALPTVQSVTSDAFTAPEAFSKTDPTAFDGTATIAQHAAPGAHTVTLTCSNGTATTTVTVGGGSPTPAPAPAPAPSSAPGTAAGGDGAGGDGAGGDGAASADEVGAQLPAGTSAEPGPDAVGRARAEDGDVPWGWITAGGIVVAGTAAGGTSLLVRRRPEGAHRPSSRAGQP